MPIARIITSMPELSGGLVRDLNSRGFEVHILSPEQTISSEADLEIRLDVAGSRQAMAEVFANNSLVMQATETTSEEDIWAMLAAFDGDAENNIAEHGVPEIVPAVLEQSSMQEPIAEQVAVEQNIAQNAEQGIEENVPITSEENRIAPVIAMEETAVPVENPVVENAVSASITPHPVYREEAVHEIDPELVPSMFNLAGTHESEIPAKEVAPVEAGEEKPYLDGNDFRDLVAKKNGSWSFRMPRLVTVVGWAAVALLLLISFMHRHSPVAPEANAGQVPFHATAPAAAVVPVKSVVITNTGVPIKTNRRITAEPTTDIAEDTIVHYNGKAKAHALVPEKHSNIKYYSDLD